MSESPDRDSALVCVTGASGFIGSHVVRELLERGHRVRATVRGPSDPAKTAHLKALPGAGERLEVCRADLLDPGSFDSAVAGCDWVCHLAAVVQLTAKNPQRDIVDPAVVGTENVLSAIEKDGSVKKLGMLSSVAAIISTDPRPGHVYTEDDWNDDATLRSNPYGLAKTRSERMAWAARERFGFELIAINPAVVLGPVMTRAHGRGSVAIVRDLDRGKFPLAPKIAFGLVDVRDVATALVNGLESEGKTGRYILCRDSKWVPELAKLIKKHFPDSRAPTWPLPDLLLYAAVPFDKRLTFDGVRRYKGRIDRFASEKVQRELGITLRSVEDSVVDTIKSLRRLD